MRSMVHKCLLDYAVLADTVTIKEIVFQRVFFNQPMASLMACCLSALMVFSRDTHTFLADFSLF